VRSIAPTLKSRRASGESFAIARVVSTWGSSPRRVGATMAVSSSGEMIGSVSGGCIEGEVRREALSVLSGAPARIVDYGVDDESAWSVGLSCGGSVRVLIQRFPEFGDNWLDSVLAGDRTVLVTAIRENQEFNLLLRDDQVPEGSWPGPTAVIEAAAVGLEHPSELDIDDQSCFAHVIGPPQRLLIIGGSDIAVQLVAYARSLGFDIILIDPRSIFSDGNRFSGVPIRIETSWPQDIIPDLGVDENTYAVLLTHDPKIDDPAIHLLLRAPTGYIGALGSRSTQEKRQKRLQDAGFSDSEIGRVHGPVGLAIGATNAAEIALSIMAEIVAARNSSELTPSSQNSRP
jgi:xanthine dehydrogenase accessory factor